MTYQEIKNEQPILKDCFFAFGQKQFDEAIEKHNLKDQKIYNGGNGLYGTKEGINELFAFYEGLNERIAKECDPQEVYNYEYDNHECSITCDDTDVMYIVLGIFTEEQCRKIKRKNGYLNYSIEELLFKMAE